MTLFAKSLLVAAIAFCGAAQASTITFQSGSSIDGPQASANDYRNVVDAAVSAIGANSTTLSLLDGVNNQGVFGGSNQNIAYKFTVDFGVTAANAGSWDLRTGVDFGRGGAVFLDGNALAFNSGNMWWNGSYGNTSQSFQFSNVAIAAGNHQLSIYGLEDCCDGYQQAQFSIKGAGFTTFGATDGIAAAVPEPETYALMLAGLAAVGFVARRSKQVAASV